MRAEFFKIINDEKQYLKVMERIDSIIESGKEERYSDELKILALLAEEYEKRKYKIDMPDPVDAILFRMDQMNLKQKDLIECIGSKSKVSEILNRKKPLTLNMIKNIHEYLGIPLEILLQKNKKENPAPKRKVSFFQKLDVVREKELSYGEPKKAKTKPVTIRIPVDVIENIKKKAEAESINYQTLIKMILKKYSERI